MGSDVGVYFEGFVMIWRECVNRGGVGEGRSPGFCGVGTFAFWLKAIEIGNVRRKLNYAGGARRKDSGSSFSAALYISFTLSTIVAGSATFSSARKTFPRCGFVETESLYDIFQLQIMPSLKDRPLLLY